MNGFEAQTKLMRLSMQLAYVSLQAKTHCYPVPDNLLLDTGILLNHSYNLLSNISIERGEEDVIFAENSSVYFVISKMESLLEQIYSNAECVDDVSAIKVRLWLRECEKLSDGFVYHKDTKSNRLRKEESVRKELREFRKSKTRGELDDAKDIPF